MCSTLVMSTVAETSRRSFLRTMGAAAAGAAMTAVVACDGAEALGAEPWQGSASLAGRTMRFERVVDCTHVLEPDIPNYFRLNMEITPLVTVERDGVFVNRLSVPEHYGTHFDTPAHFIGSGITGESIRAEQLVGPLVVIDIAERAARDPNTAVTVADLEEWEWRNGRIPRGAFVAMYSNWAARWPTSAYLNESGGVYNFPGFGVEAARFLVTERDIIGIGCDSHSLDIGPSTDYPAHMVVLGAGKIGVEVLAGLDEVMRLTAHRDRTGSAGHPTIVIGGLKTRHGSGSPVRALALV
ncbi:MAG TPA: cyclase family protein [Longimicrobiales bacterium]